MFALVEDFSGPEVEGSPLRYSTGISWTSSVEKPPTFLPM